MFTETAGGVTIGVLAKLAEAGEIGSDERVVAYVTGEGLKTLDAARESFQMHEIDPTRGLRGRSSRASRSRRRRLPGGPGH